MRCNLRCRLLLVFIAVSFCALMAALSVRSLIVRDFHQYQDGELLDKASQVIAQLEGSFERHGKWQPEMVAQELAWVLQLGFEARLSDKNGIAVLDSDQALRLLKPLMRKRLLDTSGYSTEAVQNGFTGYPLFLNGEEIGFVELRPFRPVKEEFFISSANRFLLLSMTMLGIASLIISIIASRRITRPVLELTDASREIAAGNRTRRATVYADDELGELAKSFNSMAETIEAEEKLRRRLLSGAAHELRTPLAIISGELEGMIDGVLPTTADALVSMHDEAARLTAILDGIDDLTRAEAAALTRDRQTVLLKPFLTAIITRFEPLYAAKNAVLLLDCPDNSSVNADPDRLSQIIINLLSNALKAIENGGKVSLAVITGTRGVAIEVTDDGHGIAAEDLPHIFERFYKIGGNGLGIGLAIVKELVTAHGWQITAQSRPGKTRFTIETTET